MGLKPCPKSAFGKRPLKSLLKYSEQRPGDPFPGFYSTITSQEPKTFEIWSRRTNGISLEFALRLRSRIATRSHFIAVRLSGLITAAHKRTHPIALSYLSGDLRFIAFPFPSVPFTMSCHFICVSRRIQTQENKGSLHHNSITSNKDSNCNESSDIQPLPP